MKHTDVSVKVLSKNNAEDVAILSCQLGYPVDAQEAAQRLRELTSTDNDIVFGAMYDNRVIGWIHVAHKLTLEAGRYCEVVGAVVDEQYRGKGIGKLLMAESVKWSKTKQCGRLVVRSNIVREEAHQFYLNLGFQLKKQQKIFELGL